METNLLNTFNRFCKYLEKNSCSRIFEIENDNIMFKRNNNIYPNTICYSYNWFNSIIPINIQTQLIYFLLPVNGRFSSIFIDVQNYPEVLPKDMRSLISVFGIPKSLEEINIKLDLYGV